MYPHKTESAASAAAAAADDAPVNNIPRYEGVEARQIDLTIKRVHPALEKLGIVIDPDCPPPLIWEDDAEVYLLHLCTHRGKPNMYYAIKFCEREEENPTHYYPTGEWALVILAAKNPDGSSRIEARIVTNQEGRAIHLKTAGGAKQVLQSCIIKFKDDAPGELEKWCNRSGGYHTPDDRRDQAYLSVKSCVSRHELARLPTTNGFYQAFTFSTPNPQGDVESGSASAASADSQDMKSHKTRLGGSAPETFTSSELTRFLEQAESDDESDRRPMGGPGR